MDKSIFNFQPAGKKSILLSGTKREKYKNSFEMTEKMLVGKQSELGWGTSASWGTLNTTRNRTSHIFAMSKSRLLITRPCTAKAVKKRCSVNSGFIV